MSPLQLDTYEVLKRPMVSERSMELVNTLNVYVFKVHPEATKEQIKKAVEVVFSVKVLAVNTTNRKGKPRRIRFREGKRSNWKKAYVKLAKDSKIDLI
ncbi:MAG: 50S ribosomal protein L23 [Candidatus Brocadiia bacterium]